MNSPEGSPLSEYLASDQIMLERVLDNNLLSIFDKSVIEEIFAPNQDFSPSGKYYDVVSNIIATDNTNRDDLFDIGFDIGRNICDQSKSPRVRITKFLNTMNSINSLGHSMTGRSSAAPVLGLRSYMRTAILPELGLKSSLDGVFNAIDKSLKSAAIFGNEVEKRNYATHSANLDFLWRKYVFYTKARATAGKYDESRETLTDEEYADLKNKATLLSQEAMLHRKYGTKPAYIEASVGGSWIFHDGDDWAEKASMGMGRIARRPYENIAAVVDYSSYRDFKSLQIGTTTDDAGNVFMTGELAEKLDFSLYIGKDGTISTDPDGLENLGLELSLTHAQELSLLAEIASNFYDLSMPLMKHRSEDKTFENPVDRKKANFDPIQKLLIPRIKYLEQLEDFQGSGDITRTVREHDVTWFVRTLPSGWHASPEAIAEAEYHGIELAENETFVKSHTRGSHNRVLGYHAVRRSKNH